MINNIKKNIMTIFLGFILFVGLSLLAYPTLSDYWNSFHQSKAVAGYVARVQNLNKSETSKILSDTNAYNKELAKGQIPDLNLSEEDVSAYNRTLNVTDTGIMAYVDIPKLNTTMPIYHGTDSDILQIAIGHIAGTSLPIGGIGTHAVISGHRGLPSAKLFTNIDQLIEGDKFLIKVLDETLTYEVDQILTVKPDDISALAINPDADYVTLVTCTPYGINSHRLLVRGHRIANDSLSMLVTSEATQVSPLLVASVLAVSMLIIWLGAWWIYKK
ncbi:class C sortase [Pseudolactococcus paracarnosus]|uniref:Class C sortase n=1 Tax=Pseudolactococcus paracarnosus TaxID=2749962 RepID=A0A7L4WDA0_9LACT|nr:class C sortase [Lactococcus paracarnosus]SPC35746.1 Sortase family protein [Lactococcus piscium]MCJ1976499.1 class C sortase [Lactococcus paracarnosus]MCJ1982712.1 class C sortase [Lactococcus paracarnosus]MCJ1994989.1 class C sortase [Lactococcus paracarnosus]MCJ1997674.1 class C sortase [Lactococcus paracarnosus]